MGIVIMILIIVLLLGGLLVIAPCMMSAQITDHERKRGINVDG